MKKKSLLLILLMALLAPWAVAQQALPYSYGFENNDLSIDGWTLQASSSSTKISTNAKKTGTYGFQFYYSENPAYLVSPVLTGGTNGIDVSFYYMSYSSYYPETFTVGYTTDAEATDPSTFTYPAECMIEDAPNSWSLFEFSFPAGTKKVAIKYIYTNAYYLYLDDFSFTVPASCPKPTGLAKSNVTAHTVELNWTENGDATAWVVAYKKATDENFTEVNAETNPYTLTGLTGETPYVAKVKSACDSEWSGTVNFTTDIACPKPTGLAATLTPGNGTVATLTWTEPGSATNWVLQYGTDNEFAAATSVEVSGTPSQNLTGLTAETKYYARVKAACDGIDGESQWSDVISFTPTDAYFITVNDGSASNNYIPFYGLYADSNSDSQFIIPASDLVSMQWGYINKIMLYFNTASATWNDAVYDIYLAEVNYTEFASATLDFSGMTKVYTGGVSIVDGILNLTIAPYQYLGGNLLIGFDETTNSSNYPSGTWKGVTTETNTAVYQYNSGSITLQKFLPKTTFNYTPGEEPSCIMPTGLAVNYTGGVTATVSWTSEASGWNMKLNGVDVAGPITNPYTLTGLELATDYAVTVQADCGETQSDWTSPVNFTTDLCLPEDMCAISYELSGGYEYYGYNYGWYGAYISVIDVETSKILATWTDNTPSGYLDVCDGRDIQFVWNASSYAGYMDDDYCTFTVYNAADEIILEGTSGFDTPVNYTMVCPDCPKPSTPTVSNITQNSADITWTGSSTSYVISYSKYNGFIYDFESAEPWVVDNFTPCTTYDGDGLPTYGINNVEFTNQQYIGSVIAFQNGAANSFTAHGGNAFGCFMDAVPEDPIEGNNDWFVLPELDIEAGTVFTFWARSITDSYGLERMKVGVYGDTNGTFASYLAGNADDYVEVPVAWTKYSYDLSSFAGQNIKLAIQCLSEDAFAMCIDDIFVGKFVETLVEDVTSPYTITGLTEGAIYDVKVKGNCEGGIWSEAVTFKTYDYSFDDTTWPESGDTPTIEDDVLVIHDVIIEDGVIAYANSITLEPGAHLIIEDGGQLYTNEPVVATVQKELATPSKTAANWYTISSPANNIAPASVTNLIQASTDDYDLYLYNEPTTTWLNQKNDANIAMFANLTNGRGYLYWNSTGADLAFTGTLNVDDVNIALTKTGEGNLAGFNLIGNPFSHNIYKGTGGAIESTKLAEGFYVLDNTGTWGSLLAYTTPIKPCQGILVQATESFNLTIANSTTEATGEKRSNDDNIMFVVNNSQFEDAAYALFKDAIGLTKINHRNDQAPMIYIPQDGENYAIATMGDDTETFGLNFKAMTTGMYTLSAKADGNYSYLHVIDRLTGEDIDMLVDGKYEFIGSPRDNEARFIVKLSYNANGFNNDEFIYQNGDELIVNGEGELQVYDVMGRYVACYNVNGNKRISAEQFSNAVYIFRLVGSDVKTQKIVVR